MLSIVYRNRTMAAAVSHAVDCGEVAVFSNRSPAKLSPNEDVAAIMPLGSGDCVLMVADGMGGHSAGEVAARTAVMEMIKAINESRQSGMMLRIGIINGFERANSAVQALNNGSGTTLAVVEVSNQEVRPYHAGDSVVLVVGSRGKIKMETTSHSPVGFGVAAGLLNASEAMEHAERHVILNAIGSPSMRIEIGSPIRLAARDTVLIASDGLTDNVTLGEAIQIARKGMLVDCADDLAHLAAQRMASPGQGQPSKPDDLTVLLYRNG
ncbi:MAG: protein phosphatase 2C domain-containing protein [Pirellulaceae bacterium]